MTTHNITNNIISQEIAIPAKTSALFSILVPWYAIKLSYFLIAKLECF